MEKKMVFILEDNDDIREIVAIILSDAGYQIGQCSTVKEFWLRIITQKLPDICVLDISLPDGNGIEVCKELRKHSRTSGIKLILMSANLVITKMSAEGYWDDFIGKPFDIADFRKKIAQYD